ncbi:hypothetical protein PINS_up015133 [Pythium insidiosum]|nr:hypothetical protein PINS_up015133 [Pythium insidiosum]
MATPSVAPLTAALVVCTKHPRLSATDGSCDHALSHLVSAFLDPAPLTTVARAADSGSRRWLERVVAAQRARVPLVLLDHWLLQALHKATELGRATTARWIMDLLDDRMPRTLSFIVAATVGDLALLQHLVQDCNGGDTGLLDAARIAAGQGHLDILQCVIGVIRPLRWCNPWLLDAAIQGGYRPCMEWLASLDWIERSGWTITTKAIERGDLEAVRFIFTKFSSAIDIGHAEFQSALATQPMILQMLFDEFNFTTDSFPFHLVVQFACGFGRLDTLKLLFSGRSGREGLEVQHEFKASAARGGHIDVLEYLREIEGPEVWQSSNILGDAVKSGRVDVVEWLLSTVPLAREQTLHHDAYDTVATKGYLAMLQWLFERGTTPDSIALIVTAATNGHIEMCEWLHARTEYNVMELLIRVLSSRHPVVKEEEQTELHRPGLFVGAVYWMWDQIPDQDKGVPFDESKRNQLLQLAARHGCLKIVRHLHKCHPGIELSNALEEAAENGQVSVVRYLTQFGAAVGSFDGILLPQWMTTCVQQNHLEVLMLIHARDQERWSRDIVNAAIQAGEWIHPSSRPYALLRWLNELLHCLPA